MHPAVGIVLRCLTKSLAICFNQKVFEARSVGDRKGREGGRGHLTRFTISFNCIAGKV